MIDVPRMLELLGIDAVKKADEWWAPCPAHDEKTGSWSIKDLPHTKGHGSHYCFGCHFAGGPTKLVLQVYGFSLWGSAKDWIEKHGLDSESTVPLDVVMKVRKPRRRRFKMPSGVRGSGALDAWVTPPRRYATKRGITPAQVQRWGIGYALHGLLAGRIVIPVHDKADKLASYTARSFDKRNPKYKTPDAVKERPDLSIPFGCRNWEGRDTVVVTEGAINALACERAGAKNIAALDGSRIHRGQIMRIGTFKQVILASDPDFAGDRLADELSVLARWSKFKRAMFPEGCDAATMDRDELAEVLFG